MKQGIGLGGVLWWLVLCMGAPPFCWAIAGFIVFVVFPIYYIFTEWYIKKRYKDFCTDNPSDRDAWDIEYRKKHRVASFLYHLFNDV